MNERDKSDHINQLITLTNLSYYPRSYSAVPNLSLFKDISPILKLNIRFAQKLTKFYIKKKNIGVFLNKN
jgi:hypothetical protein